MVVHTRTRTNLVSICAPKNIVSVAEILSRLEKVSFYQVSMRVVRRTAITKEPFMLSTPQSYSVALVLLLSCMAVPACYGPSSSSGAALQQALRARGSITMHRDISVWYRLCPQGSAGTESVIVAWPAKVSLRLDLTSALVSEVGSNDRVVAVARPQAISVSPAAGLADTMISPVQLDLRKLQEFASQHSGQLAALSRFLAEQYFARSEIAGDLVAEEVQQLLGESELASQGIGSAKIEIKDAAGVAGPIPPIDLCPGSILLVNGVPLLRSRADKVELVTGGLAVPAVGRHVEGAQPSAYGATSGASEAKLGTAYLVPKFPETSDSRVLPKIANGTKANLNEFPFAVALAVKEPTEVKDQYLYRQYCGGTLVKSNVVLTAGHCPVTVGHVAIIGAVDLGDLDHPGVEIIEVTPSEEFPHAPGYGVAARYDADLQLVALSSNSKAKVGTVSSDSFSAGSQLTAIGWGITEKGVESASLMKVRLTVNKLDACRSHYAKDIAQSPYYWGITDHMMCVGGGPVGACDGDSGGPLLSDNSVVATVSFVDSCTGSNEPPALFIRLFDYCDFLNGTYANLCLQPGPDASKPPR